MDYQTLHEIERIKKRLDDLENENQKLRDDQDRASEEIREIKRDNSKVGGLTLSDVDDMALELSRYNLSDL